MTKAIVEYSKNEIRALNAEQLQRAVDKHVKNMFTTLEETQQKLEDAKEAMAAYKGKDHKEELKLFDAVTEAKMLVRASVLSINDYIEDQKALFKARTGNADRAYKYAIVATGELTRTGTEVMTIVERKLPFEVNDDGSDDDNMKSVNATLKLPSERAGLVDEQKRGKFNDAGLLIAQATCGLDRAEIIGMGAD